MKFLHILIVEDDPSYALELEMMLVGLGFAKPSVVKSVKAALAYASKRTIDLCITDIYLEGSETGIHLAAKLLQKDIPSILITASRDVGTFHEAKSVMSTSYLVKPFDRISLQSAIERTLTESGSPVFAAQMAEWWTKQNLVNEHIFVRHNSSLVKLNMRDLVMIKADGNYCYLYEKEKKFAVKSSLKLMKEMLSKGLFLQANRGTLLNFSYITEVSFASSKIHTLLGEVQIGNVYRQEVESWMNRL